MADYSHLWICRFCPGTQVQFHALQVAGQTPRTLNGRSQRKRVEQQPLDSARQRSPMNHSAGIAPRAGKLYQVDWVDTQSDMPVVPVPVCNCLALADLSIRQGEPSDYFGQTFLKFLALLLVSVGARR
jgi:hypothetical protein